MRETFLVTVSVVLVAGVASAGGYHIDEQDARATGRAGAVTANPGNASAIYYNPGGVGTLEGIGIEAGASLVSTSATFTSAVNGAETDADTKVHLLPQGYVTYRLSDLFAFGVGFNSPFGLALRWPDTSPGRQEVRDIELRSYFIMPVVAMNLSRWVPGLAIGGGVDLVPASVRLERDILFGTQVATVALSGTAFGVGARGGVVYRPPAIDFLAFGVTYRSPVKLNIDGDVNFTASPALRNQLPPDGTAKTSVTLPQQLNFGAAINFLPEWELELDVDWTGWSTFESLNIELPAGQTSVSPKNWHDTVAIRVGTEATIAGMWFGRLGVAWDRTPVPPTTLDFELPDANRVDFFVGAGAAFSRLFHADVGAVFIPTAHQTTSTEDPFQPPVKGKFDVSAFVLNASVGFNFDTR
jgi:long-chain fatty acid transport protein